MNRRDLVLRLRALFRRRAVEHELDEELAFHIDMQARKLTDAGLSPDEARRRARAQFGHVETVKEDCRDERRVGMLEEVVQDVRYGLRGYVRAPLFSAAVVLTIAVGLGLNTTLVTVFNAYVLRPAAVRDPYSLYEVRWRDRALRWHAFNWDQYQDLRRDGTVFDASFGYQNTVSRIEGQPSFGLYVTGEYFQMLGVDAALGRTLLPEDAAVEGGSPVLVLSYDVWKSRFSGDSGIIGRRVRVRGTSMEVIGVVRPGFTGLGTTPRDYWLPMTMSGQVDGVPGVTTGDGREVVQIVGRLKPGAKPGAGLTGARAILDAWMRAKTAGRPDALKAAGVELESRATPWPIGAELVQLFAPIFAALLLVLVIACANVANMMLARGFARQREIGIRLSLGASRRRLVRQLLTESTLLAAPAALAAFVISWATVGGGERLLFATLPREYVSYVRLVPLHPDVRVFVFMLAAAAASAVAFGLAPALQATRPNIVQASRGNFDTEYRPARLRNALVVCQITACVLLLVSGGLLLRASQRLQHLDARVHTRDVVQIDVDERARAGVLAQLAVEPSVVRTGAGTRGPLDGGEFRSVPMTNGGGEQTLVQYNLVSADYFRALGVPLVAGRHFSDDEERDGLPVVIVSKTAASRLWPGRDAVGARLRIAVDPAVLRGSALSRYADAVVVGVAEDAVSGVLAFGTSRAVAYFPTSVRARGTRLLVQVRGEAGSLRFPLERELDHFVPGGVEELHPMSEYLAAQVYPFRVAYWISNAVGAIALLLTISGVYGVLSFVVAQRMKEFGIRMALGATARGLIALVLRQSFLLATVGIAAGLALAIAGALLLNSAFALLLNLSDVVPYAGGAFVVFIACLAAAYVPSRRATRIDPVTTLRAE